MGEYFNWVNVVKREYICPADFGFGNKAGESSYYRNDFLCALRELLSTEWRGDRIIFFGDEYNIEADTEYGILREFYKQTVQHGCPGDGFDVMCETYRNLSAQFKSAEKAVREEIQAYLEDSATGYDTVNEYGIELEHPYDGLFTRKGHDYKYTVNHTKKVCYSLEETKIFDHNNYFREKMDPLPFLLGYGRTVEAGDWLGDVVGVTDEKPDRYILLDKIRMCW